MQTEIEMKDSRSSLEVSMSILHAMTKTEKITMITHISNTNWVMVEKRLRKFRELELVDPVRNVLTTKGITTVHAWLHLMKRMGFQSNGS